MQVQFKYLKSLLSNVDRNTLETTVMKHLLRITADNLENDVLYNAENEDVSDEITEERLTFIENNVNSTCPDLYPS